MISLIKSKLIIICACMLSHFSLFRFFVTLWTVAHQAPRSMGFPRQEYWSGLPFPPPGDLPDPGTERTSPASPALQADSLSTEPPGKLLIVAKNRRLTPEESSVCISDIFGHSCRLCVFHITFRFALTQNVWTWKEFTNQQIAPLSAKDML